MKKFAVIGNPVNHSLSPEIHYQFAKQFNIVLEYRKIHAKSNEFEQTINTFVNQEGNGLNVTIPFKSEAYDIADIVSSRAELAKAVNTLSFTENGIVGDNTDGVGLVNDLISNHQLEISGKLILILGAGGAVRGILGPLLQQQPNRIVIANRTAAKAFELENTFSSHGLVKGCGLDQIEPLKFDLIINGTATSLAGQALPIAANLLQDVQFAYDMMYAKEPTIFMKWAAKHGVGYVTDGLGMLVEQAAAAFSIWHNVVPSTAPVIARLRA